MSADYIYSAELVNTRYPRQTVVAASRASGSGNRENSEHCIQAS